MASGMFVFPAIERIIYGRPTAEVLHTEVERLNASRVFLIVRGTMNRTTDEVAKVRDALGDRYAGLYDDGPTVGQIAIPTTLSAGEFHAGGGSMETPTASSSSPRRWDVLGKRLRRSLETSSQSSASLSSSIIVEAPPR